MNGGRKVMLKMKKIIGLGMAFLIAFQSSAFAAQASEEETSLETVLEETGPETAETEEMMSEEMTGSTPDQIEKIIAGMTMDEKISQMIIPAIRTWDEENVTDLSAFPELKEVLRSHQYGGIILFGANITDTEQTARLVQDLQENNLEAENVTAHIPYFMPLDEEGGTVVRLITGTRMNGNMALGATGENACANAETAGEIIGEELNALGFNVDYAPVIDVNNNAANPVIGTRSFSDDPDTVAAMGTAYAAGLAKNNIIATFKHFPGHGDTATDSHIGTPSVEKTYEEICRTELVPFQEAIDNGADMIMTAHITYPLIDDEVVYGDGKTKGTFPATMSPKIITDILRREMGFDGVVVTDALEMDAIRTAGLVPGETDSTEYRINIAEKVINAGVDILLLPLDLKNKEAAAFYDDYIAGLAEKTADGTIPEERIDESVGRILKLKEKYGILEGNSLEEDADAAVQRAKEIVGSASHHETEMEIARQAVTLVKNEEDTLPLPAELSRIVFLNRLKDDTVTTEYTIGKLQEAGLLDKNTKVDIEYYYDPSAEGDNMLHYTKRMSRKISKADAVIAFSAIWSASAMEETSPADRGLQAAMEDVHAAGGKFILISGNLPYDAARYQDADAILLAYLNSGLAMDPTEPESGLSDRMAYNANQMAAIETIFGGNSPTGILPVNIPVLEESDDGTLSYGETVLYPRGYGLTY